MNTPAAGARSEPSESTAPGWVPTVVALAVAVVTALAAWSAVPSAESGQPTPDEFSADRAMADLEWFAAEPRLPGMPAHAEAREQLLTELDELGWQTEVHESVGIYAEGTSVPMGAVTNIIATLPGTDPTGTAIVAAHYDSVPNAPGAADDGIGVVTGLEVARILADGDRPRNDVMLLITDAEEPGLLGAEAFVHDHAEDLGPAVVINLEARGNGGRPVSVRLTQPNSVLLDLLERTPRPVVDSFSDALFALLKNNTDLARFAEGGLSGFDTAITGRGAYYHTPLDDPSRLSAASLQEMGANTLAFTRAAAAEDLTGVADGEEEIAASHPWGFFTHPRSWELPLAIGGLLLAGAAVGVARARRRVTLPRTALAATVSVLALPLAAAAAVGTWSAALAIDPGQASSYVGEPYVPWPYRVACVAAVAGVVALLRALLRRALPGQTLATGALLALAVLGVGLAVPGSGFSAPVVLPVLPAAAAAVVAALLPARRPVVRAVVQLVGVLPVALLLGYGLLDNFDVGLGEGGPLTGLFLGILALLALGPVDAAPIRVRGGLGRRLRLPLTLLLVVVLGTGTGLVLNREGATDPRQEMISYSLDADTGEALWSSWSPSGSAWSEELMGDPVDSLDHLPWLGGGDLANGSAPAAPLEPPTVQVVRDRTVDGQRELTLDLSSARGGRAVGLWLGPEAGVRAASVQGRDVPVQAGEPGAAPFGFLLQGAEDPVRVELRLDATESVRAEVADLTHDLTEVPGFQPPPDGRVLVTPNLYVHGTVEL